MGNEFPIGNNTLCIVAYKLSLNLIFHLLILVYNRRHVTHLFNLGEMVMANKDEKGSKEDKKKPKMTLKEKRKAKKEKEKTK